MVWFANSAFKEFGKFDVSYLKKSLIEISETIWDQDPRNKCNHHFYETSTLWLRKLPETHYGYNEIFHVFENINFGHKEFETQCYKFHQEFEQQFNGMLIRSCIIRLLPGQRVEKHIDGDENLHRYCHRLILPIITNPQVIMSCSETDDYPECHAILEENIVYDTNGYVPHRVVNHGVTPRYALVLDFLSNTMVHPMSIKFYTDWTEELWNQVYNEGRRKATIPELQYPGIDTSPMWKMLYRLRSKQSNH